MYSQPGLKNKRCIQILKSKILKFFINLKSGGYQSLDTNFEVDKTKNNFKTKHVTIKSRIGTFSYLVLCSQREIFTDFIEFSFKFFADQRSGHFPERRSKQRPGQQSGAALRPRSGARRSNAQFVSNVICLYPFVSVCISLYIPVFICFE